MPRNPNPVLSVNHLFPQYTITDTSNATPIVVTTDQNHNLENGDFVDVSGVVGTTAANGRRWVVAGKTATTFQLAGSVGNAAYTSGGVVDDLKEDRKIPQHATETVYGKPFQSQREPLYCVIMVDVDEDTSAGNKDISVKLQGRPHPSAEWFDMAIVNNAAGTWQAQGTQFTLQIPNKAKLPVMRLVIAAVGAGTQAGIKAWVSD